MSKLTVLIPTSPIPSHPETSIIDETISNIRKYTDSEIVIMFDGIHSSLEHRRQDYKEYIKRAMESIDCGAYGNAKGIVFTEHEHQARMTRKVLRTVHTPLVMFCEHDTSPIGDIPFDQICEMVELDAEVNNIRFNIFHTILEEHKYLMLGESKISFGVPLVRTIQWSQRPHIAKTGWYKDILSIYFKPEDKTMIEDVMHSVVIESHKELGYDKFGLAIYTPEGNQLRSYHSDGRGDDEKVTYG